MPKADLPQLIADEVRSCYGEDSELRDQEEVIATVTSALAKRNGLWSRDNKTWALRMCVREIYLHLRASQRPRAADLEAKLKKQGTQRSLPGWSELLKWRLKVDGLEVAAAYATLAQIEFASGQYAKLARENSVKGRHLTALADAMRARGMDATATVEEFYRLAKAS